MLDKSFEWRMFWHQVVLGKSPDVGLHIKAGCQSKTDLLVDLDRHLFSVGKGGKGALNFEQILFFENPLFATRKNFVKKL